MKKGENSNNGAPAAPALPVIDPGAVPYNVYEIIAALEGEIGRQAGVIATYQAQIRALQAALRTAHTATEPTSAP